jgi:hypothetical protein
MFMVVHILGMFMAVHRLSMFMVLSKGDFVFRNLKKACNIKRKDEFLFYTSHLTRFYFCLFVYLFV